MNLLRRFAPVGAALPWILAALGIAFAAFQVFLFHPENVRFAKDGRPVTGQVQVSRLRMKVGASGYPSSAVVGVDDVEIGWQTVELRAYRPVGERVPLLCLTSARRCASLEEVRLDTARWPLAPGMLVPGSLFVAAAALGIAARRRNRRG